MTDYQAILWLVFDGYSYEEIVLAVGCSRRDVSQVKKTIKEKSLTKEAAAGLSRAQMAELFPDGRRRGSAGFVQPDFASVIVAMKANRHYTRLQAWQRYATAPGQGPRSSYSQFCQLFSTYADSHEVVATLHHEPARAMLVDWAGDRNNLVAAITSSSTLASSLFTWVGAEASPPGSWSAAGHVAARSGVSRRVF